MPPEENDDLVSGGDTAAAPVVEIPVPSLLDSINEALAPTLPTPAADADPAEDDDEGAADETDEGKGEAGTTVDKNGRKHGADGKLLPADGAAKTADGAGKAPAGKPVVPVLGADGKPVVSAKADPVNDPIPDEVKGRTRERMQSLITSVKEKDAHIAVQNELFDSIQGTGATPDEFGAMLGYMRWVHSDKPEDLKQAKELLLSELRGVSLRMGEAAPGIDFLADFPDLQAKVTNGQITAEDAQELAVNRARAKDATDRAAAAAATTATTNAATQERNTAIAELDALGKTLLETDPEFAVKHEILAPVLASLGQLAPPKWKAAFTAAYKAITPAQIARFKMVAVPAVAPAAARPAGGPQPLRGNKQPSGGQGKQPANLQEAIFGDGFPQ